jgi:hypothetical protein
MYWQSPEACKLFLPKGEEMVLKGIDAHIAILKKANETHLSYLDVIDNPLQDVLDEDSLTNYPVWSLQQKCLILCVALKIAKEKLNGLTWERWCAEAIDYASVMNNGIDHVTANSDGVVPTCSDITEDFLAPMQER